MLRSGYNNASVDLSVHVSVSHPLNNIETNCRKDEMYWSLKVQMAS